MWMRVLRKLYLYDHGLGETEKSRLIAAVIYGSVGLGLGVTLWLLDLSLPYFCLRKLFIATALVAVALGLCL